MGKISTLTGYIGTTSYRPDSIFSDQIHEGDITDLRSSAHDTNDMEVMNSVFNGAISGSERGSEGEWEMVKTGHNRTVGTAVSTLLLYNPSGGTYSYSDAIEEFGEYTSLVFGDGTTTGVTTVTNLSGTALFNFNSMTISSDVVLVSKQSTRKKSNTITHCDIIGDPANYPQSWKDNGVIGCSLLVGENGEDYIPDGTYKDIKYSKKVTTNLLSMYSLDNGVTWVTYTPTLNSTTNTVGGIPYPTGQIRLMFYTTHTSMTEPTVNSAVRNGVIGDAVGLIRHHIPDGSYLAQSLTNKVHTQNAIPFSYMGIKLSGWRQDLGSSGVLYAHTSSYPSHSAIPFYETDNPAVKVFPYLTTENGRKVVNLVFKEMKFAVDWGDDSKFNIVSNVSTTVDDNGQSILIGQKKIVTPYFAKEK